MEKLHIYAQIGRDSIISTNSFQTENSDNYTVTSFASSFISSAGYGLTPAPVMTPHSSTLFFFFFFFKK